MKVTVNGLDKLSAKLNRDLKIEIRNFFRDKNLRKRVGAIIVEDIKKNADFGRPAYSTLKWREIYDGKNVTDAAYRRNKLNAVFTGELLADIESNILADTNDLSFKVGHSDGKHSRYNGVSGKIGKETPYKVISKHLIKDLGYDYLQISDKANNEITGEVREALYLLLAKY